MFSKKNKRESRGSTVHPMNLAVILVNWRNEAQTLRCGAAVRSWRTLTPELIVVDNESTKATRRNLANVLAPDKLICSQINLGYGGGNNLGIRWALDRKQKYILLLNSDAEISEVGVIRLLKRLQTNPVISILGPVIHERQDGDVQCLIGGRDIAQHLSTRMATEPDTLKAVLGYPLHEVDYVSGTVFLARRAVFEQTGLLDEQFFFSGEIADLCKRVRDRRQRICVDLEVDAYHDTCKTIEHIRETLYIYYSLRNRFLYVRKHYPSEKLKYFIHWGRVGLFELARSLRARKMGKARAILLALAHAYTNQFGNQNAKLKYY
jgi:GT2 family glycosyltransferase